MLDATPIDSDAKHNFLYHNKNKPTQLIQNKKTNKKTSPICAVTKSSNILAQKIVNMQIKRVLSFPKWNGRVRFLTLCL